MDAPEWRSSPAVRFEDQARRSERPYRGIEKRPASFPKKVDHAPYAPWR
jgi:hypothetical protein